MIKIVFLILIAIAGFLFMGSTKISINPFRFIIEKPYHMIGWLFLIIGISLIQYQSYKQGLKEGSENTIKIIRESVKQSRS